MQKTDNTNKAKSTGRKVQSSTTLNRRYVRSPKIDMDMVESVEKSAKIQHFGSNSSKSTSYYTQTSSQATESRQLAQAEIHPLQEKANARTRHQRLTYARQAGKKMTAKQLKDQAIQQALATAAMPDKTTQMNGKRAKMDKIGNLHFGFGRIMLALCCTAVAVFAITYFVNLNMPDISLKVAAMQTGIDATYPSYIPRDFAISSITSEDRKITLGFKNASTDAAFTLVEETSSWDSNALLNNYVKDACGDNYSAVKEQGLTIFICSSNATWVNGGVVYKLTADDGTLTNKQIRGIATSL